MIYDTIIVGAGPAGLTAAIYTSRGLLKTLVLEKLGSGGQIAITDLIENYPGFTHGINGFELSQKMDEQAKKFGAEFEYGEVQEIAQDNSTGNFILKTDGPAYETRSVIIAAGASPRKLGVKGEEAFIGRGISFCATCDASFYKDKTVAVIGGGDSALDEGLYLTRFVKKVFIIHRRNELRGSKILQKRAFENPKVEFIWDTVVEEVIGDQKIRQIKLKNIKNNSFSDLMIDGMFLYIGLIPNTAVFKNIEKDNQDYIITDENMKTNLDGIFAAGDCRSKPLRQIATAIGDGAVAAYTVEKYMMEIYHK